MTRFKPIHWSATTLVDLSDHSLTGEWEAFTTRWLYWSQMKSYLFWFLMRLIFSKQNETSNIRDQYCHIADDGFDNGWLLTCCKNLNLYLVPVVGPLHWQELLNPSPIQGLLGWTNRGEYFVIYIENKFTAVEFQRNWNWKQLIANFVVQNKFCHLLVLLKNILCLITIVLNPGIATTDWENFW